MSQWNGPYALIVTAAAKDNAAQMCSILDPDTGGADTPSILLSPTGNLPATHYGASSRMVDWLFDLLRTDVDSRAPEAQILATVNAIAQEFGRDPMTDIHPTYIGMQVVDSPFWDFVESLGLKAINEGVL